MGKEDTRVVEAFGANRLVDDRGIDGLRTSGNNMQKRAIMSQRKGRHAG
jgi:hypothetical protein